MKKMISFILAAIMIFSAISVTVSAAPGGKCLEYKDKNVYVFFDKFTANPNNTQVSFDLSMDSDSEGTPILSVNSGAVEIAKGYVKAGSVYKDITWGELEVTHFRRIDISYSNGNCTVSIDGTAMVTGADTCRTAGMYFIGYPGHLIMDNLKITTGGSTVVDLDFESSSKYQSLIDVPGSTVSVGTVPEGSYYDYSEEALPDDVEYIFDSETACQRLSVSSGKKLLAGDIDGNGRLSASDTLAIKLIIAGKRTKPANGAADVDGNGRISSMDTQMLKQMISGGVSKRYIEVASGASAVYDADMQSALLTASADTTKGVDATLTMNAINPSDYGYAVVTYMTPDSTEIKNSEAATQSAFGEKTSLTTYDLTVDGCFHAKIIDLSEISAWDGKSATLRFFVSASKGDRLYVDSIVFTANLSRANAVRLAREKAKVSFRISDIPAGSDLGYWEDGNYIVRFDSSEKVDYITGTNNTSVRYSSTEEALKATATAVADPSFYIDLSAEGLSADALKYIVYIYKMPTTNKRKDPAANMYYVCNDIDIPTGGYESNVFDCVRKDIYHAYAVDLSSASNWQGSIKGLRIDYFTEGYVNDCAYVDSVVFCPTFDAANEIINKRIVERNGETPVPDSGYPAADVWNLYRHNYTNANGNEFVAGGGSEQCMYFRYGSKSKLTARSLGDRMARAITNATGKTVTCDIYQGFMDLKDAWSEYEPSAYVYYTIHYEGDSYVVWIKTYIIKDSSYSDELDGTSADPEITYANVSNWTSDGVSITDSSRLRRFTTYIASHSNHECKVVDTPYGTFAYYVVSADESTWGIRGGSQYELLRIYDDGSYKVLGKYESNFHTTKGQIFYAADGNVYFFNPDVQFGSNNEESASIGVGYFDPSKPNADGSYNITYNHSYREFPGGQVPGGYGYSCPVLDDANGKFYLLYNGGRDELGYYMSWFIYNYRTHQFETGASCVSYTQYRHCYPYAYADGKGGFWFILERTCLLECVGLKGIVTSVDYAWDQLTLFHVTNAKTGSFTEQVIIPPDYTQTDRYLFPTIANNICGDAYIDGEGILHVIYMTTMSGTYHHDVKYMQLTQSIFDLNTPTMATKLYSEPITFGNTTNNSCCRYVTNTSGQLYLLVMHRDRAPRCEVWKAEDKLGKSFKMVACQNFSSGGSGVDTAAIYGVKRNGSIVDNTIEAIYPVSRDGDGYYYYFRVTLPE